ncbi:MAG: metal ABC transporter permease [Bacteroidales bacterium]|nr:metal ABC transporter permease [Bacteroidales bacterium]
MDLFQYTFFQNALTATILLSVISGILGAYIVVRRLVFITGGITHTSFGGLGLGFYLGLNPIFSAFVFSLLSVLGVEWISRKHKVREDSAIAVFWSLGMAVGVIAIFMTPGYAPNLSSFLFGNILTVNTQDLLWISVFAIIALLFFTFFYFDILYVALDRDFAQTKGIAVKQIEYTMMVLIAAGIVLSIRMVGVMLLMSLFTIPQITASIFTHRFFKMVILSAIIALIGGITGLFVSSLINVPSGASIVLILVLIYILAKGIKSLLVKQ